MPGEKIKKELVLIDSLLRSKKFSYEMAKALHGAYDDGGQKEFITAAEESAVIDKTIAEEKIATNLAGFYAVECGIGLILEQSKLDPVACLTSIKNNTISLEAVLLLNRFANATWKATQAFRGLDRITGYNFTGAGFLPAKEIEKDVNQVVSAASVMLEHMQMLDISSLPAQMEALKSLLQNRAFAFTISKFLYTSYYTSQHKAVPPFLIKSDHTTLVHKRERDQKIAMNLAGFYALECGVNYLVTTRGLLPSAVLRAIENNTIGETDKMLLLRFANATWKAGQPFRDLSRIAREAFTPVYFLPVEEIEKDLVQIKTAARKLLWAMEAQL